jgi:hypothetical protein
MSGHRLDFLSPGRCYANVLKRVVVFKTQSVRVGVHTDNQSRLQILCHRHSDRVADRS